MSDNNSGDSSMMMMLLAIVVCFCLFFSSVASGVLMFKKSKSSSSSSSPESTSSSSNSKPTSSSSSSKPVYQKVGTIGDCINTAYYISPAWSPDIIDSNDPKTTAAELGDNRYNTWVNKATEICTNDPRCNAVSVWRDAGYRKYDACNTVNTETTFTNSFKKK